MLGRYVTAQHYQKANGDEKAEKFQATASHAGNSGRHRFSSRRQNAAIVHAAFSGNGSLLVREFDLTDHVMEFAAGKGFFFSIFGRVLHVLRPERKEPRVGPRGSCSLGSLPVYGYPQAVGLEVG